jgi:hypothetical protein
MAKVITSARAAKIEAPATPLAPTDEHRASARARGSDIEVLMTLLRSAMSSAPPDDLNRRTLERKLLQFKGELELFSP